MKIFSFVRLGNYSNNGQDIEQSIRYTLTGEIVGADNIPHHASADCLGYQIKSARASVCKGIDLESYLATDAATAYIYGTQDGTAYIMEKWEYVEFCRVWATPTTESKRNGGGSKLRLKHESKALLEWLGARV